MTIILLTINDTKYVSEIDNNKKIEILSHKLLESRGKYKIIIEYRLSLISKNPFYKFCYDKKDINDYFTLIYKLFIINDYKFDFLIELFPVEFTKFIIKKETIYKINSENLDKLLKVYFSLDNNELFCKQICINNEIFSQLLNHIIENKFENHYCLCKFCDLNLSICDDTLNEKFIISMFKFYNNINFTKCDKCEYNMFLLDFDPIKKTIKFNCNELLNFTSKKNHIYRFEDELELTIEKILLELIKFRNDNNIKIKGNYSIFIKNFIFSGNCFYYNYALLLISDLFNNKYNSIIENNIKK